jgi:formylglycine-generating enzyme required for sulfatase activity
MGVNPSRFKGDDLPVESITWHEANEYCIKVGGRLPTEAEWEYAARGGTTESRYGNLNEIAWFQDNSEGRTHPVGGKQPNDYGLYDMLGNVWEWTSDWYGEYGSEEANGPKGPLSRERVLRGGGWYSSSWDARASVRFGVQPDYENYDLGCRCAWEKIA